MQKKILILTPFYSPNIGGAETFCEVLNEEVGKHYSTEVCTINWGKQKIFKGTGIAQFLDIVIKLFPPALISLKQKDVDILHAQGVNATLIGAALKRRYGYKLCATLLALYEFSKKPWWFRKICQWIFNQCDIIFVEGRVGLRDIDYFKLAGTKKRMFQHWCDPDVFYPPEYRNNERMRVLFIGRPIPEKGKHIIQQTEEKMQSEIMRGLIGFDYIESVPYFNLGLHYRSADVVVVPSLYAEGLSRVVIEAATCGCAVITSDRGALPELVGGWGVAMDPDPNKFALILGLLCRDRQLLRSHQEQALNWARENFGPKNAEVFLNAYSVLCR